MLNNQIDCKTAMNQAYQMLHTEAAAFNEAAAHLGQTTISKIFIEGCLNIAMGLAHWRCSSNLEILGNPTDDSSSYLGDRYFKAWEREENNVMKVTIRPPRLQEQAVDGSECSKTSTNDGIPSRSSLQHTLHALVQFSPLIMMTIVTIAPRLGAFLSPRTT